MLSWLEFLMEARKAQEGLYVSLLPSEESRTQLADWLKENKIPNAVAKDEFHLTVVYSRSPVKNQSVSEFELPAKGVFKNWEIFPTQKGTKVLVLRTHCFMAQFVHVIFAGRGASYDFPEFKPHVTVALDYEGDDVPQSVPSFPFWFDRFEVKPLDTEYQPKKA